VGELRFLDVLRQIYPRRNSTDTPEGLLRTGVEEAMNPRPNRVAPGASLADVLGKIEGSRTGSIFVLEDNRLLGYIGLIDIVRWLVDQQIASSSSLEIASTPMFTLPLEASLRRVMELMMDKYIRRVVVTKNDKEVGLVDDRVLTNVVFAGRNVRKSFQEIFAEPVTPYVRPVTRVKSNASLLDVARAIAAEECRCILTEGHGIITPWDVAVKGLRGVIIP
jgi:predicted transcriptional regulator